ncbi:hypothetical protein KR067_000447, partial [Drosophila pandora]
CEMKPAFKSVIFLCILMSGGLAQDVEPEFPVFVEDTTVTETERPVESTTASSTPTTSERTTMTTESIRTSTTPKTTTTTKSTTTSTTPKPSITTTKSTTTSTTPKPSITTTKSTTTSTTPKPSTTTTESATTPAPPTTTTGLPSTISTSTQREPTYPTTQLPPTTTRKPTYTTRNPWNWYQPAQRCYLRDQANYALNCYGKYNKTYRKKKVSQGLFPLTHGLFFQFSGYGWTTSYSCYRCCYYDYNHISGCSKLHEGRCWWY